MNKKAYGFTVVELLIVIVVVAILAAISIVAYNGIQQRANNTARISVGEQWVRLFQLYQAQHGTMPPALAATPTTERICLGSGFPTNANGVAQCQNYTYVTETIFSPREADNTALMSELQTIGSLPTARPLPVGGVVGPFVQRTDTTIVVSVLIDGVWAVGTGCGGGFRSMWVSTTASQCQKTIPL